MEIRIDGDRLLQMLVVLHDAKENLKPALTRATGDRVTLRAVSALLTDIETFLEATRPISDQLVREPDTDVVVAVVPGRIVREPLLDHYRELVRQMRGLLDEEQLSRGFLELHPEYAAEGEG